MQLVFCVSETLNLDFFIQIIQVVLKWTLTPILTVVFLFPLKYAKHVF